MLALEEFDKADVAQPDWAQLCHTQTEGVTVAENKAANAAHLSAARPSGDPLLFCDLCDLFCDSIRHPFIKSIGDDVVFV